VPNLPVNRILGLALFISALGLPLLVVLWWLILGPPQDVGPLVTWTFILTGILLTAQVVHFIRLLGNSPSPQRGEGYFWHRIFLLGPIGVFLNIWELTRSVGR
jgi:hypothetical protein